MCRAFSGLITMEGKVYWQAGIDSHEDLIDKFRGKDKLLADDELPATFCRFEITPNRGYLYPEKKWTFEFDDEKPKWWTIEFEKSCWDAQKKWKKKVYSLINLKEARNPINPFEIEPPKRITKKHLKLLKKWDSVRDSVRASVWASVWDSVWDSVRDSVRDSVWDSVGDSVWDSVWDSVGDSVWDLVGASVWAYIGSIFKIKKWKYTENIKTKGYPFQSAVDLWKMGLVPSYDGEIWRLHSKNGIEWEGTLKQ